MSMKGKACHCHFVASKGRMYVLSKKWMKIALTAAATPQLKSRVGRYFLAITSMAKKKPAKGLVNKIEIPAVTPAHISSLLYLRAVNSLS